MGKGGTKGKVDTKGKGGTMGRGGTMRAKGDPSLNGDGSCDTTCMGQELASAQWQQQQPTHGGGGGDRLTANILSTTRFRSRPRGPRHSWNISREIPGPTVTA